MVHDDADELANELALQLSRHARLLNVIRSHMASWAPTGLDWSAFTLVMTLVKLGPARQGELAESSLLDPSTVSRHVGQLVRARLVERRADPSDGRAVQLVASPRGEAMAAEVFARRREMLDQVLAGWEPDDLSALCRLFGRLNDDLDTYRSQRLPGPPCEAPDDPLPRTDGTVPLEK